MSTVRQSNRFRPYTTLDLHVLPLSGLDAEELSLVDRLLEEAGRGPDWGLFSNYWMAEISRLYETRGLTRAEIIETILWQIAQDLTGRLGIAQGEMRQPDYRDELEKLIQRHFPTRRAFCEATGLSEDMLSHVLARRKHLAIDTLSDALAKVGYTIHIVPASDSKT